MQTFRHSITTNQYVHYGFPGMSGALWTETIRTSEELDSMVFPRLLALAERAWHKADWENIQGDVRRERMKRKDWELFVNTLGHKELSRLDELNVAYRIPPPGARYGVIV